MCMGESLWHGIARDQWGAKIKDKMEMNKIYLHEGLTTFFAEFPNREKAEQFREYIVNEEKYRPDWKLVLIDTSDKDVCDLWRGLIQ